MSSLSCKSMPIFWECPLQYTSALRLIPCGLFVRHKFKLITFWWPFYNNFSLFFFSPAKIFFKGVPFHQSLKIKLWEESGSPLLWSAKSLASLLPLPNLLTFLRARLLSNGSDSFFKNKMCYLSKAAKKETKKKKNRKRKLTPWGVSEHAYYVWSC